MSELQKSGKTKCGKNWRLICSDRKHPSGANLMVLIDVGNTEICVPMKSLSEKISSQWFDADVYLENSDG